MFSHSFGVLRNVGLHCGNAGQCRAYPQVCAQGACLSLFLSSTLTSTSPLQPARLLYNPHLPTGCAVTIPTCDPVMSVGVGSASPFAPHPLFIKAYCNQSFEGRTRSLQMPRRYVTHSCPQLAALQPPLGYCTSEH